MITSAGNTGAIIVPALKLALDALDAPYPARLPRNKSKQIKIDIRQCLGPVPQKKNRCSLTTWHKTFFFCGPHTKTPHAVW